MTTQARIATVSQGARWLATGFQLFRASPFGWLAMVFAYWMLMTFVSLIPKLGVVIAAVLVPPFAVGFMSASRAAAHGMPVELSMLFVGFRERVQTQLMLGGLYFVSLAVLLGITALADDGALARWMLTGRRPEVEVVKSDGFFTALVLSACLYVPVMMSFWFAPVLGAWHALSATKSLFFSFFACLLNWRSFLAYGVVTGIVTIGVPLVVLLVFAAMGKSDGRASLASLLLPLVILMMPVLFASFYASYRDIFGPEAQGTPPEAPQDPPQLH